MYFRSQKASKTQPLTSLSEDLKGMYSRETAKHHVFHVPNGVKNPASNVTFWRSKENVQWSTESLVLGHLRNSQTPCETAKHHVFHVPKGVKNPASNVTFRRPKENVQSSTESLILGHRKASKTQPLTSLSEDLKTMYSQAPKASSWGTCETAKHHVFQVPKGVKNPASNVTFWRSKENVQSSTESLVLGQRKASKTQPLTSLSEDLKTMYSQAPKASSWGTCETAKDHVFQVPKGVKNPASNVTFWRPKDNVQSSTQSLVLGHLRNSQRPCISGPFLTT